MKELMHKKNFANKFNFQMNKFLLETPFIPTMKQETIIKKLMQKFKKNKFLKFFKHKKFIIKNWRKFFNINKYNNIQIILREKSNMIQKYTKYHQNKKFNI